LKDYCEQTTEFKSRTVYMQLTFTERMTKAQQVILKVLPFHAAYYLNHY